MPKKIENSSQSEQEWSWEQTMKEELFNNGSITVDYRIFDDFFDYPKNGGVYQVIWNENLFKKNENKFI